MRERERREAIGPFLYRWGEGCFPVTADSLALGDFVTLRPGGRVLDLGCGAGLLLLKCAARGLPMRLFGVEQDETAAAWARKNLTENGLDGEILTGDVRAVRPLEPADVVVTNPPWYQKGAGRDAGRAKTEDCPLDEWCAAAARALREGGRLAAVYPPARLGALFAALSAARLEPKRLRLVQQRAGTPAFAVLIEGTKGGKPGLSVLPTLVLDRVN